MGLLGINIMDESFYEIVVDGADIQIDLEKREINVRTGELLFKLSAMELKLIETGGIPGAFKNFGKGLLRLCVLLQRERMLHRPTVVAGLLRKSSGERNNEVFFAAYGTSLFALSNCTYWVTPQVSPFKGRKRDSVNVGEVTSVASTTLLAKVMRGYLHVTRLIITICRHSRQQS